MRNNTITILILFIVSTYAFSNVIRESTRQDILIDRDPSLGESISRDEDELIELIESLMQTHLIPGLSISISKEGEIVWNQNFGYADIDDGIPVDENTMFILSSVSKTVTATALMQLWEQGMFDLDDGINQYLPFNVNHPDYSLAQISFKMLLSHTSGIKDNWSVMEYYDGDSNLELGYYLEEYLVPGGDFYGSNSNYTNQMPGSNYAYSNIGAALIGLLVEEISGTPFNEYCNQNIFSPLGMDNAYWFLSEIDDLNQVAIPYGLSGGSGSTCYEIGCGVYNESNPCFCDYACVDYGDCCSDYNEVCGEGGTGSDVTLSELYHYGYSDYPSGQLRTTSNNLAKFMSAYMNNGIYNGVRILESETVEIMRDIHFPSADSQQGLIWYYKNSNGRNLFGHNGGDLGSLTEMFISFSDDIGVVLLTNSSNYNAVIQIENAAFDFADETTFTSTGDMNLDQTINILDVILLVNIVLGVDEYNILGDINGDSSIDVLDVIQLVNIVLGQNP